MVGNIGVKSKSPFILQLGLKRLSVLDLSRWSKPILRRMLILRVAGTSYCIALPL